MRGIDSKLLLVRLENLPSISSSPVPARTRIISAAHRLTTNSAANSRITFTGMLSGNLKWGAFAAAEAFILPSHQENFGIAVAEALACGTPVLISDQVNIWREIVQDGSGLGRQGRPRGHAPAARALAGDAAGRNGRKCRSRRSAVLRVVSRSTGRSIPSSRSCKTRPGKNEGRDPLYF